MFRIYCTDQKKLDFIFNLLLTNPPEFMFRHFYYFDVINSTQEYALEIIQKDSQIFPSVIISEIQTAGKGRRGNNWSSPAGGIWTSIILKPCLEIDEIFLYNMLLLYVICEMIETTTKLRPVVKWPNDIFIRGKKVGGILMDTEVQNNRLKYLVMGMGLNTNNDASLTNKEVSNNNIPKYLVTTLKEEINRYVSNQFLLSVLLKKMNILLPNLQTAKLKDQLIDFYTKKIIESNHYFRYYFIKNGSKFSGEIIKVKKDGSLLVKNNSELIQETVDINSVSEIKTLD